MDPDPWMRTLDYGSGSESRSFCQRLSRFQQTVSFFSKGVCLLRVLSVGTGTGTFTSDYKEKKSRSPKTLEIRCFLNFLFLLMEVSDPDPYK